MAQVTNPKQAEPQLSRGETRKFQDLESRDPEGHGPDVAFTSINLGRIVLWITGGALVCAAVIWATLGIGSAFDVLAIFAAYLAIIAVPVGVVVWLRARSRRDMQREARGISPAPSSRSKARARGKLTKIDHQLADIEAQQRQDDDGGPPGAGDPKQGALLSEAASLREQVGE